MFIVHASKYSSNHFQKESSILDWAANYINFLIAAIVGGEILKETTRNTFLPFEYINRTP